MTRKKTYICITPFFPTPESFRGPFVYDQIKAIERSGFFEKIIVFRPDSCNRKYTYKGIVVNCFKTRQLPSNLFNFVFSKYNQKSFLRCAKNNGIEWDKVDVVHCHVSTNGIYGLAIKDCNPHAYIMLQHHDPDPFNINLSDKTDFRLNLWANYKFLKHIYENVDLHICVSKKVMDNLIAFPNYTDYELSNKYKERLSKVNSFDSIRIKDSFVLYNGVDKTVFYDTKHIKDGFTIGCVANFIEWKNQITILRAIKNIIDCGIKDVKIKFIGSGPCFNQCIDFVKKCNIGSHVEFYTEIDHNELSAFYNSINLFVLPSFFEGFGCVFLESHACGVPFIAARGQGISEIISEDELNHWLCEPYDYKELANMIIDYKKNQYSQTISIDYSIDNLIKDFITKKLTNNTTNEFI